MTKAPTTDAVGAFLKLAATYSPTWYSSTIGAGELNFSVRDGKRWILTAVTTVITFLTRILGFVP